LTGEWVQTSYNNNPIEGASRGKYAGIGDTWNGTDVLLRLKRLMSEV
jgi:hypothetical protein